MMRAAPLVEVAAALVRDPTGRYLLTQRLPDTHLAGRWEFPGGKREAGETLEECLARELREELNVDIAVGDKAEVVRWEYPDKTVVLHFYHCRITGGRLEPRECAALEWVEPARLAQYDFPPADRQLVERLRAAG
jgi:8-oxo-dGTP diphosphatase